MDTTPNVATSSSDPQSNDTSNFDEILALISAISLSPRDAQRLTTAIRNCVGLSGDTENDGSSSASEETSLLVPAPIVTATASDEPAAGPPAPALVVADESAGAPVQVQPPAPALVVADEPKVLEAVPVVPAIPAEHFTTSCRGVLFLLPLQNVSGPYYLITKGRTIGVIADWSRASPLVTGVKGAIFRKVSSVGLGLQTMLSAINNGSIEYL